VNVEKVVADFDRPDEAATDGESADP
jgi:hypothetical protein